MGDTPLVGVPIVPFVPRGADRGVDATGRGAAGMERKQHPPCGTMTIHKIINDTGRPMLFCGPRAICAITGVPVSRAEHVIRRSTARLEKRNIDTGRS